MRHPLHRGAAAVALALAILVPPGAVQAQDSATLEAGFEILRNKQRFLISGNLILSDSEGAGFWAAYDKYVEGQRKLDRRTAGVIAEVAAGHPTLPSARAQALIEEHLSIEEARLKLLRSHVKRLKKVLSPAKLAKYLQLQNKLDVSVRHELSQRIPLLQ